MVLHLNPRLDANQTVLNSKANSEWSIEEKQPLSVVLEDGNIFKAFNAGQVVQVVIKSDANSFEVKQSYLVITPKNVYQLFLQIFVNGTSYCHFKYRIRPEEITHFKIAGDIEAKSVVYHSKSVMQNTLHHF